LANNYGADGGSIRFDSALNGINSGMTSGGLSITYSLSSNGTVLTAATAAGTVFIATLQPASATYQVQMIGEVDGGQTTIDFNGGGYNFVGGNGPWAGFTAVANDSKDLLLTAMTGGVDGGTVNTTVNTGGISGGASIGLGEAMRIDFVVDLTGSPGSSGSYGDPATHAFEAHYDVNGASALFTAIGSSGSIAYIVVIVYILTGNDLHAGSTTADCGKQSRGTIDVVVCLKGMCGWVAIRPTTPRRTCKIDNKVDPHSLTEADRCSTTDPPGIDCGINGTAVHPTRHRRQQQILAVISHSGESSPRTVATDEVIATTIKVYRSLTTINLSYHLDLVSGRGRLQGRDEDSPCSRGSRENCSV
jgi:hypothetical protein